MAFSKNHPGDLELSQASHRAGAFVVTFYGVRGSIATPGPETVEVGGNTSCVEIQCGDRHLVFDTVIPKNISLEEAHSNHSHVFAHAPTSAGARAYRALVKEVVAR